MILNEFISESESKIFFFLSIRPLLFTGCIFAQEENAWMTTFGMDFAMKPLTGDRPNDPDRVPHYFVVITERDD